MKLMIDEASVVGVYSSDLNLQSAMHNHSVEIRLTGNVTALTVNVEGSLSGNHWGLLASHILSSSEISNKGALFHIESKLVEKIRVRIINYSGTGTVSIWYTPYPN